MFRYETHLHTYEGSLCGVTPGSLYPQYYKDLGYDGIFITDHFSTAIQGFLSMTAGNSASMNSALVMNMPKKPAMQ